MTSPRRMDRSDITPSRGRTRRDPRPSRREPHSKHTLWSTSTCPVHVPVRHRSCPSARIRPSPNKMKVTTPESDYYRLRMEWLRFKSHLYDRMTGLPALPAVIEDVRRTLESRG